MQMVRHTQKRGN